MPQTLSAVRAAEIHRLMSEAAACYNRGDIPPAKQGCERALALLPDFPQALHLLGLCQWREGQWNAAADALERAAGLNPQDGQIFHDLGCVYSSQGRWAFAIRAYLQAIELRPGFADSYLNMGAAYENTRGHEDAERAYRRALELNPKLATAAGSLAALCEGGNRLAEAEQFVQLALGEDADDPVANLTRAQLDFRAKHYHRAAERLEALLRHTLSPRNRSLALARLGGVYEIFGEYDRAFEAFQASKEALNVGDATATGPGIYTLDTVQRISRHLPALMNVDRVSAVVAVEMPVFLVGFPRSGTTLLDQILSSHSWLSVLEEKENFRDLLQDFVSADAGLEQLTALDETRLDNYRRKYWSRVAEALPQRDAELVFVDKLPLNTIFMPLIVRLFPQARFIFAVRDPRDVVLSCFMRAFGLNEAMRNFLTLEGTATYYAAVMKIGIDCLQHLGTSVHLIRYEALVGDTQAEAQRLCTYLGVDWDPAMLEFQETARKRRINTPSYHQVTQPIYKSAQQRWRKYERHLRPVLPQLQPFVEYFGYS